MKNYLNNIPLRTALIIPFAFLVVMAIGFVGYVSYANGRLAVNDVASQLRSELTLRIQDHLRQFLKTPHQINQLNADMLNQGLLNINNPAEMERHFFSQISTFDSVTSIYMGNVDGGVVNSGRDFATNSRYIIVTDDFKSGPLHKIATTDTGRRMEILATVPNFDARTRPWYFGAVKKGAASWSPVYIISTGQDMAIAASQPIYDDQKQLLGVVSTDIFLSHISHFIKNLKMGQTGIAFIVDATGFLIASSNDEKPFTKSDTSGVQQRRHAEESLSPIIRHAARILSGRFNDQDWANGIQQFDFTVDNQRQLMQVTPLRDGYGLEWTIVVVIPEADFMSKIIANNSASVFVIVVVLVFALAIDIVVT
ncbi:MAG: cache domain-containing protein, partial [Desulfatirhabdiaceae bacterium]